MTMPPSSMLDKEQIIQDLKSVQNLWNLEDSVDCIPADLRPPQHPTRNRPLFGDNSLLHGLAELAQKTTGEVDVAQAMLREAYDMRRDENSNSPVYIILDDIESVLRRLAKRSEKTKAHEAPEVIETADHSGGLSPITLTHTPTPSVGSRHSSASKKRKEIPDSESVIEDLEATQTPKRQRSSPLVTPLEPTYASYSPFSERFGRLETPSPNYSPSSEGAPQSPDSYTDNSHTIESPRSPKVPFTASQQSENGARNPASHRSGSRSPSQRPSSPARSHRPSPIVRRLPLPHEARDPDVNAGHSVGTSRSPDAGGQRRPMNREARAMQRRIRKKRREMDAQVLKNNLMAHQALSRMYQATTNPTPDDVENNPITISLKWHEGLVLAKGLQAEMEELQDNLDEMLEG